MAQVAERPAILSGEVIDFCTTVLHPTLDQRGQRSLDGLLLSYASQRESFERTALYQKWVRHYVTASIGIEGQDRLVRRLGDELDAARADLAPVWEKDYVQGGFLRVAEQIQAVLGGPTLRLPPGLGFLRRIGEPDFPSLRPLKDELVTARAELSHRFEKQVQQMPKTAARIASRLSAAEEKVIRSKNRLVDFVEVQVAGQTELVRPYIDVMPDHLPRVASTYARLYADSELELRALASFIQEEDPYVRNAQARGTVRLGYANWLAEGRTPTKEDFDRMPQALQQRFQDRVRHNFIERYQPTQ